MFNRRFTISFSSSLQASSTASLPSLRQIRFKTNEVKESRRVLKQMKSRVFYSWMQADNIWNLWIFCHILDILPFKSFLK